MVDVQSCRSVRVVCRLIRDNTTADAALAAVAAKPAVKVNPGLVAEVIVAAEATVGVVAVLPAKADVLKNT